MILHMLMLDMWLGAEAMQHFGTDFGWSNYEDLYAKVCADFNLQESDKSQMD